MIHRYLRAKEDQADVVNCFQNPNFGDDSQDKHDKDYWWHSCELAFRILILGMIHRKKLIFLESNTVVNCFQNPNFRDDSQGSLQKCGEWGPVVNCFQNPNFRDDSQELGIL